MSSAARAKSSRQRARERVRARRRGRHSAAEAHRASELAQRDRRRTSRPSAARARRRARSARPRRPPPSPRGRAPTARPGGRRRPRRRLRAQDARAAGVAVARGDPQREVRRQRAEPPGDRVEAVGGDRADVVAGRAELVGRQLGRAERVVDDRVDEGVLQEQRAPAGAVERVAEEPDVAGVGVGDGADRADADVAGGHADGDRRAGHERLRRRSRPRAARRAGVTSVRPALRAARTNIVASDGPHARQRQRRGEAVAAGDARARGRGVAADGGSTGSARIASIGVARPTAPPYSPIPSEIAPMLRATPAPSGQ